MERHLQKTIGHLKTKKKILFLTTSNRWVPKDGLAEKAKSTQLAEFLQNILGKEKVQIIDIPQLLIFPCEGNISTKDGNMCGIKKALLKDDKKNPSGLHRCWASINNPKDELWKISKALFESDCVIFFGSVRWGQMNSFYQKLIERLSWVENRHSTLGEKNVLAKIDAGIIATGHNWNGKDVIKTQKDVLKFYGFNVVTALSWNWQFTSSEYESIASYKKAITTFQKTFLKK